MQLASVFLLSFAALGAVANPINSQGDSIDVRGENNVFITYTGTCTKANNQCRYKAQNGKTAFAKCPKFANKKVHLKHTYVTKLD
ncbi:antifungal protein precursor [Curvularia clavata]|uniref:Antifungal protein n=1 Tax=Curvularia clavata TaxID=95742 RepID=A0A9Q9DVE4_CURCL|nr:antifungal protein precursor [Curvularia clavata]